MEIQKRQEFFTVDIILLNNFIQQRNRNTKKSYNFFECCKNCQIIFISFLRLISEVGRERCLSLAAEDGNRPHPLFCLTFPFYLFCWDPSNFSDELFVRPSSDVIVKLAPARFISLRISVAIRKLERSSFLFIQRLELRRIICLLN